MNPSPFIILRTGLLSLFMFIAAVPVAIADHVLITRHFTGIWTQPDHESQGLVLQISDQLDDSKLGVAYWFTYGDDLFSSWFLAVGPVDGHSIGMTLFESSGVGFLQEDVEGDVMVEAIGTMTLRFRNCNQGVVSYDTPADVMGTGEFRIRRIASVYRARCTGGISDDTPHDARPLNLDVRLHSVRDDIPGRGEAGFKERPERSSFKVSARNIPDGLYSLGVCSQPRGDMEVMAGHGALDFRSPPVDDTPLLDFDPRDCLIELMDGEGAVLSSGDAVLAEHGHGPPGD